MTAVERLDEIEARAAAATEGPWEWRGNADYHCIRLITWNHRHEGQRIGQVTVMDFARAGMQGAEPRFRDEDLMMQRGRDLVRFEVCHDATTRQDQRVYRGDIDALRHPDATFIAAARQDVPTLVAALHAVLAVHAPVSRGRVEDCCSTCCTDEECVSVNDCGIHTEIEAAITAALDQS